MNGNWKEYEAVSQLGKLPQSSASLGGQQPQTKRICVSVDALAECHCIWRQRTKRGFNSSHGEGLAMRRCRIAQRGASACNVHLMLVAACVHVCLQPASPTFRVSWGLDACTHTASSPASSKAQLCPILSIHIRIIVKANTL